MGDFSMDLTNTNTNRREFLKRAGLGTAVISSLGGVVRADQQPETPVVQPVIPATPFKPGKAKSVIQIWLWGGPSHLDMFDPKPEAGKEYFGQFEKPIDTTVSGMKFGNLLPLLATQADKLSVIRSMTHGNNHHETAAFMMQTGREPGAGISYPNIGAIVSLFKGIDNGYDNPIPPYVVLTTGQGRFSESGFLGARYKPFVTGGNPNQDPFLVSGFVVKGMTPKRQDYRRGLIKRFDILGHADPDNPVYDQLDSTVEHAYNLIQGDAVKTFNLSTENAAVREKYGRTTFGQSCLMARRLVEAGVPYITINSSGWDTHKKHFEAMNQKLPEFDKGVASLIEDLAARHLLDTTIIWACGEFGRTPKVDPNPPWFGGRHHFGACFSVMVAGGGFKGGQILGASNEKAEKVVDRPVYPQDLLGSILELMGINPDAPLPNTRGYDVPVMLAPSEKGRLQEIMV
jgi:hypothetical protein